MNVWKNQFEIKITSIIKQGINTGSINKQVNRENIKVKYNMPHLGDILLKNTNMHVKTDADNSYVLHLNYKYNSSSHGPIVMLPWIQCFSILILLGN